MTSRIPFAVRLAATSLLAGLGLAATSVSAAPIITTINADISSSAYTFSFLGSSFTLTGTGGFPNYLAVSTSGGAAVRTVFGTPSTDFTNRGTVTYDSSTLGGYAAFASLTSIPYTNGENFLGLRVTSGGSDYYGYLFSTNSTLNSYGFETRPNTAITASTALAAAVPEPASWAMMIAGFGLTGAAMRRRRTTLRFA